MKPAALLLIAVLLCLTTAAGQTAADPLWKRTGHDGDGSAVPLAGLFAELASATGLTLTNALPAGYDLRLPRLWRKTDTWGDVAVAACRLAGDVVFRVAGNRLLLAPAAADRSLDEQLAGGHGDRPLDKGDLVLLMGPALIPGTSIQLSSLATSGSLAVEMGGPALRAEWFFARHWSAALALFSFQAYLTGTSNGDRRASYKYYNAGVDFWFNPQRDLGLLPGFAPLEALDLGLGLALGILDTGSTDDAYYALPGDKTSRLTDANPLVAVHVGISVRVIDGFMVRLDWYAGRLQHLYKFPDIVNLVVPSLAVRF